MKSLETEDLRLEAGSTADVQEINTLKALKNPVVLQKRGRKKHEP
ncbi:MAG TPA: hypothetical protein VGN34_21080 [Ktedonobacteraceae bacterium]